MAKVLMVAHWDWVLYNFRLPLAKALQQNGYEVVFVCPFDKYVPKLQAAGFRCIHWPLLRRSLNPLREVLAIWHLASIYRTEQPNLVHHFTIKPNLYGSLAVHLIGYGASNKRWNKPIIINTFTGLGFLFSSHFTAVILRIGVLPLLRLALNSLNTWMVVQNRQDLDILVRLHLIQPNRASIIAGTGVNTHRFYPSKQPANDSQFQVPVVLMACRLLWDKGVGEFVEASRLLKQKGILAQFWLVGAPDQGNPACVPEAMLRKWHCDGLVQWLGYQEDMSSLLRQASIAVLPSYYYEGVPLFLLEAGATGLPLVATDIEGCRMVVQDGKNGFLVPQKNSERLAEAIETLLKDSTLRKRMGELSRALVESEFNEKKIITQYLTLYRQLGVYP